ncbi:phosphoesterase, MJ0936 family [Paenibacillus sophorae]|uniref:Metallophosphatase family protein n=1 Tax=Paenibacillus sophorae TaxID=1333845 RepID=A0A1H8UQH0_9BACL|nr:metallophosphoesterase family protein [Paenibacillus sophorae]QWU13341.1 metallophosphatase family protein [Paenibacillus sophorae]SEP05164.1 phosphoesterase, MJ0936 family [Paenibacillus sophorae]
MTYTIAVISDIHSNALALEAVLQDIDRSGTDLIVNLGDSLFGPVDPLGTARLLRQRGDIVNIMGNCDEILLEKDSNSLTYRHVKPLLNADTEAWIADHLAVWRYEDLLFCHGTPFANGQYLLEEVTETGVLYKKAETLQAELHTIQERGIFCGHSHVYHTLTLPDGKWLVNPGSVGLPAYADDLPFPHSMESGTPCASFCMVRRTEGTGWNVEHKLIPYDWNKAADIAERNGRPDYAIAIRSGRAR